MADRWSNPSGGLGIDRFRVWPAGTDSYSDGWYGTDGNAAGEPSYTFLSNQAHGYYVAGQSAPFGDLTAATFTLTPDLPFCAVRYT